MTAERAHFSIDPESVAAARAELREIVQGAPIAEAAVEGFSDWQVIEAMERFWAVAISEIDAKVVHGAITEYPGGAQEE